MPPHASILAWRIPWTPWGRKESDTTERLSLSISNSHKDLNKHKDSWALCQTHWTRISKKKDLEICDFNKYLMNKQGWRKKWYNSVKDRLGNQKISGFKPFFIIWAYLPQWLWYGQNEVIYIKCLVYTNVQPILDIYF